MGPLLAVIAAIVLHGAAQEGLGLNRMPAAFPSHSSASGEPNALWTLMVGAAALCLPWLLAKRAHRAAVAGDLRRGHVLQILTENSGWIAFGVLLLLGRWIEVVREWTGATLDLNDWPEAALGLSFLPFVVYQFVAIDASVRAGGGAQETRRHLRAFQMRMFVACLAPIAVFIGASVVLGQSEWLRVQVEHVGLASVLFTGLMVVVLAQLLPALLRWSWDTVPFPEGPQRERLDAVAVAADFEPRDLRLWRTGDLMANAAIVGFRRRGRTVLFSDQLLSILNTRELCAVYAHEIGHARRGHVAVFLAWTLGFVFLGDYAARATIDEYGALAGAGVGVASLLAWYFSFGWLSRRFELDADLFSLQTVEDLPALVSALERVGGRNREKSGWRHFGVGRRIRFLARAVSDERFVTRFRTRLRRLSLMGATLAVVGAGAQLVDLVRTLPRDRAVASLAQGQYGAAASLATSLDGEDADEIRSLAAAAKRIGGPTRDDASEALSSALDRGDTQAARELATLAALRGVAGARSVAIALEAAVEGASPEEAIEDVPQRWRDAVALVLKSR